MDVSRLNDKAAPLQREAKGFVGCGLLGVNPDDQHTGGTQELDQPVKRYLEGFERAPPPIDQRYVVLASRTAAVCSGCRARIEVTFIEVHEVGAFRMESPHAIEKDQTRE